MSVTAAKGFQASGIAIGIKASGMPDLALISAAKSVVAVGVFTSSVTAAPPVVLSRRRLASGRARAVVVNSGCANAGTGGPGMFAAESVAIQVADQLGCSPQEVLVCSTGPIGTPLPLGRIEKAIPVLVAGLSPHGSDSAAVAIMTTDSVPKTSVVRSGAITVGGIAKGAGMIRPDMATMLAFLTTDAVLDRATARSALGSAVDVTFNCLNVDGCQSTNDTALLFASGESGVKPEAGEFAAMVKAVCADLARQMAADAEGATKVVHIEVAGAATDGEAARLGMAVADSALVRASFYGADPNWGRVFGALGVAGVGFDPRLVRIEYQGVPVCTEGTASAFDESEVSGLIDGDFTVSIWVGAGSGTATVVTTDLTPEYVHFNSDRS